jgi:hypothetical protein
VSELIQNSEKSIIISKGLALTEHSDDKANTSSNIMKINENIEAQYVDKEQDHKFANLVDDNSHN